MTIREMERADIAVCAEIMRSVYNNELWQCRWTNETAADMAKELCGEEA
ncbi:MAG: hypothetical protein K2O99_00420 [Lachnospiraceae bacterium]|nr:hypothetical protein [Lachnospiraceae bacterium]